MRSETVVAATLKHSRDSVLLAGSSYSQARTAANLSGRFCQSKLSMNVSGSDMVLLTLCGPQRKALARSTVPLIMIVFVLFVTRTIT